MQQLVGSRHASLACSGAQSCSSRTARQGQHTPFRRAVCRTPQAFRAADAATQQQQKAGLQVQRQQHKQPGVLGQVAIAAAAAALTFAPMAIAPEPAAAADTVKIGTCLLQKCQVQLARCLGDVKCFQNIVCLNACNAAEDEAGCQIRCGDLYGDKAVDTFNACAVSDKKCVPQRADEGLYPVPPDCALDRSFDLNNFTGRWYITAGYNPLFDTFDCQEHYFATPEPGKMAARINWRINTPNGDFMERSVVQTFIQNKDNPAILFNGNNEYLHYEDTWYILAYKPDTYAVIYYKGKNDAWDGYGGATVYTKARQLPPELIPELSAAVEGAGLKWSDFRVTDNSCKPHPPPKSLVEEIEEEATAIEKGVVKEAQVLEKDVELGLRSFGRGFTVLEDEVVGELSREQAQLRKQLAKELAQAERVLTKVEREVALEEKVLEDELNAEVQGVQAALKKFLSGFKPSVTSLSR